MFLCSIKTAIEKTFHINSKPIIKENTFLLWEPCSKSHSEVVPGYAKYLLDLGYNVSVIVHNDRIKEGLFSRFSSEKLFINKLNKKQFLKYLQNSDLSEVQGILVTTVGKLCDEINFDDAYNTFNPNADKSKIFFVAHEAEHGANAGTWKENLITLRELNYKGAKSVVVNPHYFGDINITGKNQGKTNFLMIGALKANKKNNITIIDAVDELNQKGITNFKVTVIGKGHIKNIPQNIRKYFDIKGRLPFSKMYDEIEKADYILTAYDEDDPQHIRYNTTGTSGNFQLVYGFLKPCVIIESFTPINGFDESNTIIYKTNSDYATAMEKAINLNNKEYKNMQNSLKEYVDNLYKSSLKNLKGLING